MVLVSATQGKCGILRVKMLYCQNIWRSAGGLALTSVRVWREVVLGNKQVVKPMLESPALVQQLIILNKRQQQNKQTPPHPQPPKPDL